MMAQSYKIPRKHNFFIFLLICSFVVYLALPNLQMPILLFCWATMLVVLFQNIAYNIPIISFLIAIFTFLLSRLVIPIAYSNRYILEASENTMTFKYETYQFISTSIFVSIIAAFLGYCCVGQKQLEKQVFNNMTPYVRKVRQLSKDLYYITLIFELIVLFENIFFVWKYGYLELFLKTERMLPAYIYKIASINILLFYIFLATLPEKKSAQKIIYIYLIYSFLTLFVGARTDFIINVMFLIIYYYIRNTLHKDEIWMTKRNKIVIAIVVPFILILMFMVMLIRGNNEIGNVSSSFIVNFLYQQGSSVQVLGLVRETNIPNDKLYSFGMLIDKYYDNFFFHLLGIAKHYDNQTMEMAIHGHLLSNYLTYTYQTDRFLRGGGMGSCYIAEVWNDFGYIGLFIWSFIYGVILKKIYSWCGRNIWGTALAFIMIMKIIYSPRSYAISFIADLISPTYFFTMLFIHIYAKKTRKRVKYEI